MRVTESLHSSCHALAAPVAVACASTWSVRGGGLGLGEGGGGRGLGGGGGGRGDGFGGGLLGGGLAGGGERGGGLVGGGALVTAGLKPGESWRVRAGPVSWAAGRCMGDTSTAVGNVASNAGPESAPDASSA
jgi:hypothetical protein